jgi:hypothetical protein
VGKAMESARQYYFLLVVGYFEIRALPIDCIFTGAKDLSGVQTVWRVID